MTTIIRKDWDTYFMDIAYMASTRSRCPRRRVGAVLVQGKKLMGSAYNGAPMGVADCAEAGCMIVEEYEARLSSDGKDELVKKQRCIRTIHAEQNLILFTDREDREGSTVYVTDEPCWTCANMLTNSGIAEVVYHRSYPKDTVKVKKLLAERGLIIRALDKYEPPAECISEVQN